MDFIINKIGIWTGALLGAAYCACLYIAQLWLICVVDGKGGLFYNAVAGASPVGEKEIAFALFFLITTICGVIAGGLCGWINTLWVENIQEHALKVALRYGLIGTFLTAWGVCSTLQVPQPNFRVPWFAPQAMCAYFNPLTLFSGLLLFALRYRQKPTSRR